MMLVRADPTTKTISLLSFPRDLDVPIYCPLTPAGPARPATVVDHGRINSAYAYCGSTGALETVRHLTNLPINYLISVNFLGFIAVVNKLGGVWMDIDRRYYNKNVGTGSTNFANIDLQPGYQRLTGKQALDFVRYRHTDSDLFRLARQQQFVSAARQQIASSIGLDSLVRIVNTIAHHHYLEIGVGGGGQFSLNTVFSYAKFAYGLPSGHVFQVEDPGAQRLRTSSRPTRPTSRTPSTASSTRTSRPRRRRPTSRSGRRSARSSARSPPTQVTLAVLNGNGRAGSASNASYLLGQQGYQTVLPPSRPAGQRAQLELLPLEDLLRSRRSPATASSAAEQVAPPRRQRRHRADAARTSRRSRTGR